MIAALPMYDRPECREATDRLWALIRDALRARGIAAPDALTRGPDPWNIWQSRDLVLAQTCGLPYRARLAGEVTLIGAPIHRDGPAGTYHSVIVAREEPLPDLPRLAVNDPLSQSGWANLHSWLGGRPHGPVTLTGAHLASSRAVMNGRADIAAIDAVTWEQIARYDHWAAALTIIGRTPPLPALPYIARPGADLALYRAALSGAIAALGAEDRDVLNLYGLAPLEPADYLSQSTPPPPPI